MIHRLGDSLDFQSQALVLRSERQRLLASNIANADTPGYLARDMDFAAALRQAGLGIEDIGLFELNEAFAVQVIAFLDHYGIADDDERVNPWGGAIAVGHPLASSGVRLMTQLAHHFEENPHVRYGLVAMCIGIGMGGCVIWENPNHADYGKEN